jgi:hypothetical protein
MSLNPSITTVNQKCGKPRAESIELWGGWTVDARSSGCKGMGLWVIQATSSTWRAVSFVYLPERMWVSACQNPVIAVSLDHWVIGELMLTETLMSCRRTLMKLASQDLRCGPSTAT